MVSLSSLFTCVYQSRRRGMGDGDCLEFLACWYNTRYRGEHCRTPRAISRYDGHLLVLCRSVCFTNNRSALLGRQLGIQAFRCAHAVDRDRSTHTGQTNQHPNKISQRIGDRSRIVLHTCSDCFVSVDSRAQHPDQYHSLGFWHVIVCIGPGKLQTITRATP